MVKKNSLDTIFPAGGLVPVNRLFLSSQNFFASLFFDISLVVICILFYAMK